MVHNNYMINKITKIRFLIYFFLIILANNKIICDDPQNIINLTDTSILNTAIIFNHDKWRGGRASTNKNGDMIIEFSLDTIEGKSRLFYGLQKNGRYYFPEESFFKEIGEMRCDYCDDNNSYGGLYGSRNLFISLINDTEKSKQYLFSMTSSKGLVELIDIENNFEYHAWDSLKFFNLTSPIYSYEYSLFELEESNTYITTFRISNGSEAENIGHSNIIIISKFSIGAFNIDNELLIKSSSISNANSDKVVSAFQLDIIKLIIVMYVTNDEPKTLNFRYYNDDLEFQGEKPFTQMVHLFADYGQFFKGISMLNDHFVLAFYNDGWNGSCLSLQLKKFENMTDFDNIILSYNFTVFEFIEDVQSNGLFKLDEDRLILFSTDKYNKIDNKHYGYMHMFLIDFYNNYEGMKIREFIFNYPGKRFSKDVFGYKYNGYILFSTTLEKFEDNTIISSIMMLFGFANGTDLLIDISPFLMDTDNYNGSNNLYDFLIDKISIDNNIFGYEIIEKIKLVAICDELLLYQGKLNIDKEEYALSANDSFDTNNTLIQNKNITKEEDKLYILEYQYMVKEPNYTTFYSISNSEISSPENYDASQYYQPKIFYGRTNILQFKLCHKYCITCKEYGLSDNNQKCLNCQEQYSYDYLANIGNFTGNCVPYGQMYDIENEKLIFCNSTIYKYYYNISRNNDMYCFKYDYNCPYNYIIYNNETNECIYYNSSEIPTTLPLNIDLSTISTTYPESTNNIIINTSYLELISSTYQEQCIYGKLINYISSYSNLSNEDIFYIIKQNIFPFYCLDGKSILIEGINNNAFQVSNSIIEKVEQNKDSTINLKECENVLKDIYDIQNDTSLLFLKYLKLYEDGQKQTIKYEVYHPTTYEVLNLSKCENNTIDIYIPLILEKNVEKLYNELLSQGYNPLDLSDKFYVDICTPYTTENGTDMLLDDREEFIYNLLVNKSSCSEECYFAGYNSEKKHIKCECNKNDVKIVNLDLKHFSGSNIYKSFISTLKSTNYFVLTCYDLAFNFKIFKHNYGSIITFLIFVFYLVFFGFFIIKGISPFKLNIARLIFKKEKKENNSNTNIIKKNDENKSINPPKKRNIGKFKNINISLQNNYSIDVFKQRNEETIKSSNKSIKRPSNIIINSGKKSATYIGTSKREDIVQNLPNKEENNLLSDALDENKQKIYDNYELNNLKYEEAYDLDNRPFLKTYWSVLMREHVLLLTFFAYHDYNLFYVKIAKFLILFFSDMTVNCLFFVHESMHRKYTLGEDFTFVQKMPQLLFTLIISNMLEVFLCYLSMTDAHYYEIKEFSDFQKEGEKIIKILKCIKIKLIVFYIFNFILAIFFWYFVTCFCAVYKNTQLIFLKDSIVSFATSLAYTFIIYGFTTLLRFLSLAKCCKKNFFCRFIYKLSDIIPFF